MPDILTLIPQKVTRILEVSPSRPPVTPQTVRSSRSKHPALTSTLAGALVPGSAHRGRPPVFDRAMPEEINRVVTDHLSDLLFSPSAVKDFTVEGITNGVHPVGLAEKIVRPDDTPCQQHRQPAEPHRALSGRFKSKTEPYNSTTRFCVCGIVLFRQLDLSEYVISDRLCSMNRFAGIFE